QADEEFAWSLWKCLQVANPDLTQAVSLVVKRNKRQRPKTKKVLEILQVKDNKIQKLQQQVTGQQQEINNHVQRKIAVDEENSLMKKELAALQQKLEDKSQELKVCTYFQCYGFEVVLKSAIVTPKMTSLLREIA
ncbi:hypothetical protein AOXY_G2695, partial [Acipenser oxyrinchus oxyrinchus]